MGGKVLIFFVPHTVEDPHPAHSQKSLGPLHAICFHSPTLNERKGQEQGHTCG